MFQPIVQACHNRSSRTSAGNRPFWITAICVTAALAAAGCSAIKVGLGARVPLDKTPVTSMTAKLAAGTGIAPGLQAPLVVSFTQPDGKILLTEGKGGGKVMWKDLNVVASVVDVNEKGVLSLREDPRYSEGKTAHVTISAPSHPDLHTELDIPIRYDAPFVANFPGAPGSDGMNGMDGSAGSSGTMGSTDPNNPSAGGNGGNGTDGSNGKDGDAGGNAPNVLISVAVRPGDHILLQVSVTAAGQEKLFLVDPQGGSLTVKADGGRGGSGGRGGRGGSGGSGGIGSPNGSSGLSGQDGRSGFDGAAGKGGSIRVAYDPAAKPFLDAIHLSNWNGPKPTFNEQPVASLW
ncbi:MAG TPA: hypothetical protein VKP58_08340 [Candidatus Acidoferrum sp.]|nr:hypothetical protein [Candidatus Acidoferrum sp.]